MQEELKHEDESIRADMKLLQNAIDEFAGEAESKAFYNMRAWIIAALHDPRRTPVSGEVAEGVEAWARSDDLSTQVAGQAADKVVKDQQLASLGGASGQQQQAGPIAQGIDHAKLAEGGRGDPIHEFAMLAIGTVLLRCGEDEANKLAETYRQARGQQAGGAEE